MSAEKKKARGPKPEALSIELDDGEKWEDVVGALVKKAKPQRDSEEE